MTTFRWLLAAAVAVTILPAGLLAQQTGTIRGRVTDAATQRPLAGAQVSVVGTAARAQTGASGEYELQGIAPGRRTVRAELVGRNSSDRTVSVTAGAIATVNFALSESAVALDAIVVTATGESRAREIATSLSKISAKNIEAAPVQNPQDVIAGRVPGVTVLSNSGQPGSGGTIRIRGTNSITQGNSPLIYVDGVRIYNESGPVALASRQGTLPLNDINAEDIESVEIVKGAAATTLYGTEASGGVIQIFTKKGSAGAPIWNAEVTAGFHNMGHLGPDSDETGLFLNRCRGDNLFGIDPARGDTTRFVDVTCPESGSWLQNGPIQRYNVSVRGGAEQMSYFLSGNYNNEEGVVETGWNKDGGFRGNFSFRPAEKLDFALSTAFTRRVIRWVPDGNNGSGLLLNVSRGPFNNFKGGKGDECAGVEVTCVSNGYILSQQNFNRSDHFISGLTINYRPTEKLSNRFAIGYDFNSANNETVYPYGYPNVPRGLLWGQDWEHTKLSLDYVGSFQNNFGSDVTSNFSWGGQLFEDRDTYTRVDANDFAGPAAPTLGSGARTEVVTDNNLRYVNAGIFLQEMLGWRDRLFITAGLRVDGNSAFGENFGLQPLPKLSASYVLSEHEFWPTWWNAMKLRAAVGYSSKAPGVFDAVRTYEAIAGDDGIPAVTPAQLGNADLGPELTREFEAGFDANFIDGRLGLDVTVYRQNTSDALIGVELPPSEGFLRSQLQNIGELQNTGAEVQLNAGLVQRTNLDWRARVNYSRVKSEALDLGGRDIFTGLDSYVREGFPVPSYFGARVINPNEIADPIVVQDTFIGEVYPTRTLGIGTTLTFQDRLTLDVLGEHHGGQYLANWVGYQNARRGTWQPCFATQAKLRAAKAGDASALAGVTALERARCGIDRRAINNDFWIEPADFFKLRSVSLTYNLPEAWTRGFRSTSITLAGRNLFTSTDYSGTDPEVQDARDASGRLGRRDYYNLPPVRTFTVSARVSF